MNATFGSISSGTMRNEDLIPEFAWHLEQFAKAAAPHPGAINPDHLDLVNEADALEDFDSEEADELLSSLFDALNEYAPAYGYFGAHPGDGADYGFWLSESFKQDFDGLKVSDTSEVPEDYCGEVLHINDHGNMTLYSCDSGRLSEVWSLV